MPRHLPQLQQTEPSRKEARRKGSKAIAAFALSPCKCFCWTVTSVNRKYWSDVHTESWYAVILRASPRLICDCPDSLDWDNHGTAYRCIVKTEMVKRAFWPA